MKPDLVRARRLLYDDFSLYARHALRIRTKEGEIHPLILNAAQQVVHAAAAKQRKETGMVRAVVLKARQQGLSTYIGGRLYWLTSQRKARKTLVIAHLSDSTRALFDMTKRYHEQVPDLLRPATSYSSRRELTFSALDSSYVVATAGSESAGRGETLQYVHASELAFWPVHNAAATWNGLTQAVPNVPDTEVYVESTANGVTGLFYQQWQAATSGESGYIPVFIPWFVTPEYRLPIIPADFERSPEECELVRRYGLNDHQLAWRRRKIAQNGLDLFKQEYPAEPDEAFLTTGRPVFNPEILQTMAREAMKREPIARLALDGTEWGVNQRGELTVYLEHDPKERYYIGADVGLGVRNGDWSVAQVLDSKKRQAATWRARVDPDYFATVLYHLGMYYNTARMIVERNNHGILTCTRLGKDLAYPDFFTEEVVDDMTKEVTTKLGFYTSVKTKPLIIDQLRASLRETDIELHDRTTLSEMQTYVVNESGQMGADGGCHDDTVTALALVNHIHEGRFEPVDATDDWYTEAI